MESCFVEELVLLFHDFLLLTKGTDDVDSSHAFVEVAVDGSPDSATNLAEIFLSSIVVRYISCHDDSNDSKADD